MLRMVINRIWIGIGTLLVVSILVFIGTSVLPGDVAEIVLGQSATPESLAAFRAERGLDKPLPLQYLHWLGDLLRGDFGPSMKYRGKNVGEIISQALPTSLALGSAALLIALARRSKPP